MFVRVKSAILFLRCGRYRDTSSVSVDIIFRFLKETHNILFLLIRFFDSVMCGAITCDHDE